MARWIWWSRGGNIVTPSPLYQYLRPRDATRDNWMSPPARRRHVAAFHHHAGSGWILCWSAETPHIAKMAFLFPPPTVDHASPAGQLSGRVKMKPHHLSPVAQQGYLANTNYHLTSSCICARRAQNIGSSIDTLNSELRNTLGRCAPCHRLQRNNTLG